MPIQSANIPEVTTVSQWKGINQQLPRGSIEDSELWWCENLYAIGPGNLRSVWGPSAPIYTAASGKTILRIFFGYFGSNVPANQLPPPGRMGFMFLSDGTIDQVDLDTKEVTTLGGAGTQVWQPVAPYYWAALKVWRPRWVGNTVGQTGGVVIGSPLGLFAWDGTTLTAPGQPSPEWLSNEVPGVDPISPMPQGLPGIHAMEVYQERLWVAGENVISFSAPTNGANFSTVLGGGSFGYYGDKLRVNYMDLAATAGYLFCFGDSSTDMISNVQASGAGTPADPVVTQFLYANIDPQVGHGFPRPVGTWGRYFTICNGNPQPPSGTDPFAFRGGVYLMFGGDAQVIGQKISNVYSTLDISSFYPTFAPMTMYGFRVMLLNGTFTDPFGIKRSMLLAWNGDFWTPMSQTFNLTNIGTYEDSSVMVPYGTDGTSLYRLFDHPDPTLVKRFNTKAYRGSGNAMLTIKNFKRLFMEFHDIFGNGVSFVGQITTSGGGIPAGVQDIGFQIASSRLPVGQADVRGLQDAFEPQAINSAGIEAHVDLESKSPDFSIERFHIAAEQRTLFGA